MQPVRESHSGCCVLWITLAILAVVAGVAVGLYFMLRETDDSPGSAESKVRQQSGGVVSAPKMVSGTASGCGCTNTSRTHYCCAKYKFFQAIDATGDLEAMDPCDGLKRGLKAAKVDRAHQERLKQAFSLLFKELEEDAAKGSQGPLDTFKLRFYLPPIGKSRKLAGTHTGAWDTMITATCCPVEPNKGVSFTGYIDAISVVGYRDDKDVYRFGGIWRWRSIEDILAGKKHLPECRGKPQPSKCAVCQKNMDDTKAQSDLS